MNTPPDAVSALLPCPHCGVPTIGVQKDWLKPVVPYFIKCHVCPVIMLGQTECELTEQWNRRTPPTT